MSEVKDVRQKGYVIATRSLTRGEKWLDFTPGELIVFKDGEIVYRSTMPKLTSEELKVLKFIKEQPHRVSLKIISDECSMPLDDVRNVVRSLLSKGLIRQDSRDRVGWNHEDATFYTNPYMKNKIEQVIQA